MYYYKLYNFRVCSEIALPNLEACPNQEQTSLEIRYASVSVNGIKDPIRAGVCYQENDAQSWFNIPSIGRFLIQNGTKIHIETNSPHVQQSDLTAFLYHVCFEVLLKQRGLAVIRGQALKILGQGVAFAGQAGLGQELLCGLFLKRGHEAAGGGFFALDSDLNILPGPAQVELKPILLSRLGWKNVYTSVRPGIEKYIVPLDKQHLNQTSPLQILYLIEPHQRSEFFISAIPEYEKKSTLFRLLPSQHSFHCNKDALNKEALFRLHVPVKVSDFEMIAEQIEQHLINETSAHDYS